MGAFQTKERSKGTKIPNSWKGKRKMRRQKTKLFLQQDEGGSSQEKEAILNGYILLYANDASREDFKYKITEYFNYS